jgi:hypothetical protein
MALSDWKELILRVSSYGSLSTTLYLLLWVLEKHIVLTPSLLLLFHNSTWQSFNSYLTYFNVLSFSISSP